MAQAGGIRPLRLLAATLAACAFALLAGAVSAQAYTLVVAANKALCPNAGYSNLQQAIEFAQSHDTIKICPGTYVVGPTTGTLPQNGLTIEKSLTIIGAGANKVTIEPGGPLATAGSNVRSALGNIISVKNTAPGSTSDVDVNVSISGVTITDNGFLVGAGVAFNNAVGSVLDSQIGPFTGSLSPNAGWGVVASNNEAVTPFGAFVRDVTVSGDLITGYGAGGVLIDGSESTKPIYFRSGIATTGHITNNVITGAANAATPSQVGVQVNAGARAAISGNVITGNLGASPGSATSPGTGVGILLTDADDTSTVPGSTTNFYTAIGSNDLTGNGYGIFNGTADFPPLHEIYVNGSTFTPTSVELPESLVNTTMSTPTAPVTVFYDVPGVPVHGSTPKGNWYGSSAGPLVGKPSAAGVDGVSATTTAPTDEDSVIFKGFATAALTAPVAPVPVTNPPPTVSWGTPIVGETLTAGQSNELLALASDFFGVSSVEITAGTTNLGSFTTAPYVTSFTPPSTLVGHLVKLTATATDEAGQTTVATEEIPVVAAPKHHAELADEGVPGAEELPPALPAGTATLSSSGGAPVGAGLLKPRGFALHLKRSKGVIKLFGSLLLPAGVTPGAGCSHAKVAVAFNSLHHKPHGYAALSARCAFAVTLHGAMGAGRLALTFEGDAVLGRLVRSISLH